MDNAFITEINRIAEAGAANRSGDTVTIDGIRYCANCKKPIEIRRNVLGTERLLPIICDCQREEERRRKEAARLQTLADARRRCFSGEYTRLSTARISDAYLEHPREAGIAKRYIDRFAEFYQDQQGLLLYGPNGTGKSFLAAAICNALIEGGHDAHFATFSQIDAQTSGFKEDRRTYIESLNEYALLVLDDLGAERKSDYMQELVFTVIDSRYSSGKPVIITTNLSLQDLKNPQTAQQARIYDRVLEICYPVEMSGASIRRKDTKRRYFETKSKLEEGETDER